MGSYKESREALFGGLASTVLFTFLFNSFTAMDMYSSTSSLKLPIQQPPRTSASSTSSSWRSWTSQSSTLRDEPVLRIAVIGGGIAGLTLGQLLQDTPHVEITVYEKSVESVDRLCGYRVMLSSFVLQNLQAILPSGVWAQVASSIGVQPANGQELRFFKR